MPCEEMFKCMMKEVAQKDPEETNQEFLLRFGLFKPTE